MAKTTGPSASLDRGSPAFRRESEEARAGPQGAVPGIAGWPSVQIEPVPVVEAQGRVLVFLLQKVIADNEGVDLAAHKATERVFGGASDRLTPHVEAGIDDDRAPGQRLETAQQRVSMDWLLRAGRDTLVTGAENEP